MSIICSFFPHSFLIHIIVINPDICHQCSFSVIRYFIEIIPFSLPRINLWTGIPTIETADPHLPPDKPRKWFLK